METRKTSQFTCIFIVLSPNYVSNSTTDIEMSETLGNENVFPKSPSVRARIFFLLFDSVNVILLEMLRC